MSHHLSPLFLSSFIPNLENKHPRRGTDAEGTLEGATAEGLNEKNIQREEGDSVDSWDAAADSEAAEG